MARARIDETAGRAAVRAAVAASAPASGFDRDGFDRDDLALAVRFLLQSLAEAAPGGSVEVRVPPFGAVQAVEGPRHTRGTPPNVVEMDARTFVAIAVGQEDWASATAAGRIRASGSRSDLAGLFPLAL